MFGVEVRVPWGFDSAIFSTFDFGSPREVRRIEDWLCAMHLRVVTSHDSTHALFVVAVPHVLVPVVPVALHVQHILVGTLDE